MNIYQTAEYQQACLSKESAPALTSSVSTANSSENKRLLGRTDPEVCGVALAQDRSSKYVTPRWEDHSTFRNYVDEAKRRRYSEHSCAALFGWKSARTDQVSAEAKSSKESASALTSSVPSTASPENASFFAATGFTALCSTRRWSTAYQAPRTPKPPPAPLSRVVSLFSAATRGSERR